MDEDRNNRTKRQLATAACQHKEAVESTTHKEGKNKRKQRGKNQEAKNN